MVRLPVLARSRCVMASFLTVLGLLTPALVRSQTTWVGGTGNWSNPLNWTNGLPNATSSAAIGNGSSPNLIAVLDINATTSGVSLNSAGVLIAPSDSLTTDSLVLDGANSFVTGATGAEILNASVISGHGTISNVAVGQTAWSTDIYASGGALKIQTNSLGIGNSSSTRLSLFVDPNSSLTISGGDIFKPGQGEPHVINVQGVLVLGDGTVTGPVSSFFFNMQGANSQITDGHGGPAFASGLFVVPGGTFQLRDGANLTMGDFSLRSVQPDSGLWNGSSLTTANFLMGKDFEVDASSLKIKGDALIGQWSENAGIELVNGSVLNVAGNLMLDRLGPSPALNTSLFVDGSIATISGDANMVNDGNHDLCPRIYLSNASAMTIKGALSMTGFGLINLTDGSTLTVDKNLNIQTTADGNGIIGALVALTGGSAMTVNGSVSNNGGSVQVDHSSVFTAKSGFTQTGAGATLVDGLINAGGSGMQIQDGILSGNGVINGNVIMGGTLTPGDPTGAMTIIGNYTQTSTGTLVEQVGWISGFSKNPLFVTGNATLGGTLVVESMLGYFPQLGDSFILMLFNSGSGTFSNLEGLDFGGGIGFEVEYEQHDVKLVAKEVPEPGAFALFIFGLLALAAALFKNKKMQLACRS